MKNWPGVPWNFIGFNKKVSCLKEKEEWILILKKIIGQDQQDRQDNAASGRKVPRRRRKNS